ncbi:(2Fe-2S)-binding protein [Vreelandella olivaria]|uniref:(2Fe-2S)-binding protein n=1 Tax=Vreelandella olivaria TaxID=390919 RepID=UPI00201F4919|nr:(2Fe-2S)-binding protein [Halomonas olivaria]
MTLKLNVNGQSCELSVAANTSLLDVLRNDLALNGPKYGCGLGECGACSVLVDGKAARACVLPVTAVAGHEVITLEGMARGDRLDPVQQTFIDAQAAQCGYCLNGMIISVRALLNHHPSPTQEQIRAALEHNLCRCGTHLEILEAARQAVLADAAARRETVDE